MVDDQVREKLKSVVYPHALAGQIKSLVNKIESFKQQITKKDEIIEDFEKRSGRLKRNQTVRNNIRDGKIFEPRASPRTKRAAPMRKCFNLSTQKWRLNLRW